MHFIEKRMKQMRFVLVTLLLVVLLMSGVTSAKTIVMGDFSWESVQVHNRIAGFILEHGFGFDVEYMYGESIPIILGLRRGDVHITTELWIDNLYDAVVDAVESEDVMILGPNYPNAPQGWYVPTYVIEGDESRGIEAVAPDLKTVDDLKKYAHLFPDPTDRNKGRFHNAPTGWVAHDINNEKIEIYGLDEYYNSFNTGSDAGLSTVIVRAYERGEPFVAYNWDPNWVIGLLDMTMLEEPAYDSKRWNEDFGTAYPASKVLVFANTDFIREEPRVGGFLANYTSTLEQTNEFLAYMEENGATTDETALWFLKNNGEIWQSWLVDQDIIANVINALEGK